MRIERIYDITEVLKCLPFEREIRNKGRDNNREANMLMFVESQLQNPLFGFWIAYDNSNSIVGYVVAMMSTLKGMERVFIFRIYAKQKDLISKFEEILREWTKPYKIRIAQITISKHIKGFQKLLGFKPVSVNMERRY